VISISDVCFVLQDLKPQNIGINENCELKVVNAFDFLEFVDNLGNVVAVNKRNHAIFSRHVFD